MSVSRRLVAVLAAAALLASGLGVWAAHGHHDRAKAPSDPIAALAWNAAHRQQAKTTGTFLVATYRPNAGLPGATALAGTSCRAHEDVSGAAVGDSC